MAIEPEKPVKEYTREETMNPTKWIKVKKTGVETPVSVKFFDTYVKDGWFIEIASPVKVLVKKAPAKKE